ncbi:putative inosine-5'-monophosphate dehydrogenase [Pyrodictium delaneyi]|uniref:Malate dehydrogenase n=1 Tax=Pyrodictium delaneyi TaxID=1273541 RepID=A0A0P0N0R2_9CREN|nr:IMP dehydrogenase [Pyrodictium delaneyi]ALL00195.1 putative inosine-5'-monophosphate dehydrogenase [Pyrodictium delaneyi]OWJ54281.1 malate dehydrogenase [Pyrodictium delaneyi]
MAQDTRLVEALSFDDVVLVPALSPVEPWQVDITSKASRNVAVNVPLLSAPMDTVSEWRLAVVLALLGGIGVIHRNMSVEEQRRHVEKVKNHPIVELADIAVYEGEECCRVRETMRTLGVRQLPVVDAAETVKGYVEFAELETCSCGTPVAKLTKPGPVFELGEERKAIDFVKRGKLDAAAVTLKSRFLGAVTVHEALAVYSPALDEEGRLRVAAAISPFDIRRAQALDGFVDILVSDVAHFHNVNVISAAKKLVKSISTDFVAGNLGTREGVLDTLSKIEKVDGLRMGIAGGSICTTSGVAGIAAPTLFAVMQARSALEELGVKLDSIPIIADGGIRGPGDAVKALAAGASAVMTGYMLAGTDEAAAPLIRIGSKLYKPYRGMASRGALERRYAADRYSRVAKRVEEGIEGLVEYRGPIRRVILEFVEGLKAGLGYAGASSIPELWRTARFARITSRIGAYTGVVKTN